MTFGLPSLLSGLLLAAPATMPATAPSTSADALVAQLLGSDLAARETARQAILDAGDAALPALRSARAAARDPDAQLRLDTLLVQVKERADVGPSRVTLKFNDATLDTVLESLGKQVHAEMGGDLADQLGGADQLPRVTLDLHDVSFWQAVQAIQAQANIVFLPQNDGWHVMRNFGQGNQLRGTESGAFLVQPSLATYSRRISYAANMGDSGEAFAIQFQTLAEPKVRLSGGTGTVTLERAVDANGNDLLAQQRVLPVSTGAGQGAIVCSMPLKYPKNPGATIAEIRGTLKVAIARRTDQMTSDDLLADHKIESTFEGVKVRVEAAAQDENAPAALTMNIIIETNGDPAAMQRLLQNFQQLVHVTDGRGAPMRLANSNQVRGDMRGAEYRFAFISSQPQQPGRQSGPYKLRIEVPSGFRELEVPFVMRDLKMP